MWEVMEPMISEYASAKISLMASSILGSLISFRFLHMSWKGKLTAVASAMGMTYAFGPTLSIWLNLQPEFTGCLMGLFGIAICDCLYRAIKNSDLSIRFTDLLSLFRKD